MLEKCQLCKGFFEKLQKLLSVEHINAFGFLSGEKPNDGRLGLCDSCNEKINVIVRIKQSATVQESSKPMQKSEKEAVNNTEKKSSEEILEEDVKWVRVYRAWTFLNFLAHCVLQTQFFAVFLLPIYIYITT